MEPRISFWHRLLHLIAPETCVVCGARLGIGEEVLCLSCNLHLPRTDFAIHPYDNEMARRFWGRIPVERATALFYYEAGSEVSRLIHSLKYHDHPEVGRFMGQMAATEFAASGFFDGIDALLPVPLERHRQRRRGYNQSMEIVRGIHEATGIPIAGDVVRRITFGGSQTHKSIGQRMENVERAFAAAPGATLPWRHVLIVDDVVTSGATICACHKALRTLGDPMVSVMSLGMAK